MDEHILQWVVTLDVRGIDPDDPEQNLLAQKMADAAQRAIAYALIQAVRPYQPHAGDMRVSPVYAKRPAWAREEEAGDGGE